MKASWSTAIVLAVAIVFSLRPRRSCVSLYEATSLISVFVPMADAFELSLNVLYLGTRTMFDVYTGWSTIDMIPASSRTLHVFLRNFSLSWSRNLFF